MGTPHQSGAARLRSRREPILNSPSSILTQEDSYLKSPLSNLNSLSSTLLPPSSVKEQYFYSKCPKISGISGIMSKSAACSFFQVKLGGYSLGQIHVNRNEKFVPVIYLLSIQILFFTETQVLAKSSIHSLLP